MFLGAVNYFISQECLVSLTFSWAPPDDHWTESYAHPTEVA